MVTLSPIKRRLVYVSIFEVMGIFFATIVLMVLNGGNAKQSLPVAIIVSTTAVIWNFIYNTLFEAWEARRQIGIRTFRIRAVHAVGFEGGLCLFCLPIYMLWYSVGVWEALAMEAVLLLFFLVYTFLFTLAFDQVFTLPHMSKN